MRRLGVYLAHHRRTVVCLIMLLSIPPALGLWGTQLFDSVSSRWVSEDEEQILQEVHENFTTRFSGFPWLMVLESEDFFEPDRIAALHDAASIIADEIRSRSRGDSVFWIGSLSQISPFGTHPLLPKQVRLLEETQEIAGLVASHRLVRGQLLSEDRKTMLMGVTTWDRKAIESIRAKASRILNPVGIQLRVTGPAALWAAHRNAFKRDHERIILIAAAVVVGLALIIFRGLSAIVVSCSGPVVGIFWTLGWLELLGLAHNDLAEIILPVMIMMVGFTDGVHLVVHIRQQRLVSDGSGLSIRESQVTAAASAIEHVGGACLLTSLTTAIGFGSLMLADFEVIQGFGRACAIGVVIAFVAAMLVIPVLSTSWIGRRIHIGSDRDIVKNNMQRLVWLLDAVIRHSRAVTVTGIIVTAGLMLKSLSLQPDDRLGHRVPHSTEAYQTLQHCDATFGGIRPMRILISWKENAGNEVIWEVLSRIETALNEESDVSRSLSIRDALSLVPGTDGPAKLGLTPLLPDDVTLQFWSPELRQAQVLARVRDLGMAHYRPILDRLQQKFAGIMIEFPDVEIDVTGEAIIESEAVQRVVEELFYSLAVAALIIFAVITIAVRSFRFGILSLIPNLFPLVATGAIRACIDTSLDISSACSFAICLGIAVDDTIHFLMRFRHESELGNDVETSIRNTFMTVGSALVMTTVVMVAGIGSVLSSELPTHFLFASMACATIGSALLGDLVILPALLACFADRGTHLRS